MSIRISSSGGSSGEGSGSGSGLTFKGSWDASTNTPTITSGTGTAGDYYIVSVAGSTNIDGISNWEVSDWIVFQDETNTWQKIAMEVGLQNLNGEVGATQSLAVGTSGTDFNISSSANTHTFNMPDASLTNRGALLSTDYQKITQQTLTSTANATAWDADNGNQATLSLTEDTTISAITNASNGEVYTVTIFANGGNRVISWNSAFKDLSGITVPDSSILTGKTRSFTFVYDSASGFFTHTGISGDGKVSQFHGITARDETTEVYEDAHTKFRWDGVSQQPQFYNITTGWRDGSIMKIDGNSAGVLRVTSDDITSATSSWRYFTTGGTQDALFDAENYAATYYIAFCPESFTQPQPTYYITIVCGDGFSKVKWLINVVRE